MADHAARFLSSEPARLSLGVHYNYHCYMYEVQGIVPRSRRYYTLALTYRALSSATFPFRPAYASRFYDSVARYMYVCIHFTFTLMRIRPLFFF